MAGALKIALVGSRGIPAKYGGAETFAEEISRKLIKLAFEVYVTCKSHSLRRDEYNSEMASKISSIC